MARLCPALPRRSALTAGEYAEVELLDTLERGLSLAYTLFHSVDWSRSSGEREQHGEIDIVGITTRGVRFDADEVNGHVMMNACVVWDVTTFPRLRGSRVAGTCDASFYRWSEDSL
jgi:hypothetical protein